MIFCKGYKKDGKVHSCEFIFSGDWGSHDLVEHEKYHKRFEDGLNYFWLGFEIRERFEKRSGRDIKN